MQFAQVSIPAVDPDALSEWYGQLFGVTAVDNKLEVGATTLAFRSAAEAGAIHLAFRTPAAIGEVTDSLERQASILSVEGEQSRRFGFLDAEAVYFADPAGNVLECLCYDGDPRESVGESLPVAGVTEVGLPAPETLALVEWLEETVGLSAWGSPSESFAWVGDRNARFVVLPTGSEWYPTEQVADSEPISVSVVDSDATPGTYEHPELPYEVSIRVNRA